MIKNISLKAHVLLAVREDLSYIFCGIDFFFLFLFQNCEKETMKWAGVKALLNLRIESGINNKLI